MRYARIKENDVINGEGVNVSVYFQGCEHYCKGCFNAVTWDFNGGKEFTDKEIEYIIDCLDKNNVKRNLSILGGEPMHPKNIKGVMELCRRVKAAKPEKKIYVWSGYLFEELVDMYGIETFEDMDILIDGKFEEEEKDLTLLLRGSKNQRVIDLKKSSKNNVVSVL